MVNRVENPCTSETSDPTDGIGVATPGRVSAARYSRKTCRLVQSGCPAAWWRSRASTASACQADSGSRAYTSTFASTNTGSAAVVTVHILAPEGVIRVGQLDVMTRPVGPLRERG